MRLLTFLLTNGILPFGASLAAILLGYFFLKKPLQKRIRAAALRSSLEELLREFRAEVFLNYMRSLELLFFFEKQNIQASSYTRYSYSAMYKFSFGVIHTDGFQLRLLSLIERMENENRALEEKRFDAVWIAQRIRYNTLIKNEICEFCFNYINRIIEKDNFNVLPITKELTEAAETSLKQLSQNPI